MLMRNNVDNADRSKSVSWYFNRIYSIIQWQQGYTLIDAVFIIIIKNKVFKLFKGTYEACYNVNRDVKGMYSIHFTN